MLLVLTTSTNLEISQAALELTDNLIYFNKGSCEEYLIELGIMNVLMQLIDREEKGLKDPMQHFRLTKMTHIIFNLMLSKSGRKHGLRKHEII